MRLVFPAGIMLLSKFFNRKLNTDNGWRILPYACLAAVISAAALRADVAITSGTVVMQATNDSVMSSVQAQGAALNLTGSGLGGGSIARMIPNSAGQTVTGLTFDPSTSTILSGAPKFFAGSPLQLVYNGNTYPDQSGFYIFVTMAFRGPQLTATNTTPGSENYNASVANLPFTMTGNLVVRSGSATGPVVVTVPISGVGVCALSKQGNSQQNFSRATYTFRPDSPTKFTLDTSTQGLWSGSYGTDGYLIPNGDSKLPSYAKVTFTDETLYTWATQTTDTRALENGPGSPAIASAYTRPTPTPFSININFNDGQTHRVALYLLDWDSFSRVETIAIKDAVTGNVIDTETLSNFHPGYYAIWNLQGNVVISVTPAPGASPVVSGIFFDAPASATPANFTLATTPITIAAGLAGNSTVVVNPVNGDAPVVTLATVNWPSGITGTFGTNPTSTGSPVTINVDSSVRPGSYSLTIKGTSGKTSANSQIALTVSTGTAAGFSVTTSPLTISAGFTGTATLTSNTASSNGDPGLSVTAGTWPAGILLGNTSGSSVLVTVLASVTPGTYLLPISVHSVPLNADADASIALTVTDPPAITSSALFIGTDPATQGAWNGKYGADGFTIAAGGSNQPSYATVNVTGADTFTWAGLTDDVRALQTGTGATAGIASSYFAPTFNIVVSMSDSLVHAVDFYFLDWDSLGMAQIVTVVDTATGAILDQQKFTGYAGGLWAVWNLKGNVTLMLSTAKPAYDATCSGVFFDPPAAAR